MIIFFLFIIIIQKNFAATKLPIDFAAAKLVAHLPPRKRPLE